jgi:hypothetical protein
MDATLPLRAPRATAHAAARVAAWLALAALTGLLVANTVPYFGPDGARMPFLEEKGALASRPAWRAFFLVHVAGGLACLLAALPLFSRALLAARPAVHRALGWTYVGSALALVVPTGLYLAPTAKGGVAGPAGFVLIGASLLVTTGAGLREVLRRDFVAHRAWMVRSYAMAASALSFRVVHVVLGALAVPRAYEIGVWASWGVGVVAAEAFLSRPSSLVPRRRPS